MASAETATSGFVPVEGGELYYEVSGSGPALVLIHAGVAHLHQWDEQIPVFAPHYRVIRYDARGYGKTRTTETSYSDRQDLHDLLRHLGVAKAAVLGNSRGGQIAVDFTLEHPDMVTALVPVAAGLSGYPFDPATLPAAESATFAAMEAAWEQRDLGRLADLMVAMWADGPGQPAGRAAPSVRRRLREMIAESYDPQRPEPQPLPLEPPAASRLGEIRVPTLVLVGDLDTSGTLAAANALAEGIAGARKVVFPGVAHMVNMEAPTAFDRVVLGFLAGLPAPARRPAARIAD